MPLEKNSNRERSPGKNGGPRRAESAFNQVLGGILVKRNPQWQDLLDAESTRVLEEKRKRPDILIAPTRNNPVAIETEYEPARAVENDARQRLGRRLLKTGAVIEHAFAIRIPESLSRAGAGPRLDRAVENAAFKFAILTAHGESEDRFPKTGWATGDINSISRSIELCSLSRRAVETALAVMEKAVGQAANWLESDLPDFPDGCRAIAKTLHQKDGEQTRRMAMAIVVNAMVFHEIIAGRHDIQPFQQLADTQGGPDRSKIIREWERILREINYWPIFRVASDILRPIRSDTAARVLERLMEAVGGLSDVGITTTHDLAGRMFQRLITDRKFLATFYTLPESALLLAELGASRLDIDWTSRRACEELRVADFACGTGTLLSAAYHSVIARARQGGQDPRKLHPMMIEKVFIGTDIMPAAAHLATSQLAGAHPTETFKATKIYTLAYGKSSRWKKTLPQLGALEFIEGPPPRTLFETGSKHIHGEAVGEETASPLEVNIPPHSNDLVIMNPPFTRPTGHEADSLGIPVPAFAGFETSEQEQKQMSGILKKMRQRLGHPAGHGNAGLATNFIDVADKMVRDDGHVALVLPATFVNGKSWMPARMLLTEKYRNHIVVTIAATGQTESAFSADTGMAECLVVSTKCRKGVQGQQQTLFVNLHRRPRTLTEALQVAEIVKSIPPSSPQGELGLGEEPAGNYLRGSLLTEGGCAHVKNANVIASCRAVTDGRLRLPQIGSAAALPVARLGDLGTRGPYSLDIMGLPPKKGAPPRGPFTVAKKTGVPEFPILWKHKAPMARSFVVEPDAQGAVREGQDEKARRMWADHATTLHFTLELRLNSQSLAACVTPDKALGGRSWPGFRLHDLAHTAPVLLWANSTLGIMNFWWHGTRQQGGRVIMSITKLSDLHTLDPRQLNKRQMEGCAELLQEFLVKKFLPAHEACRDPTRIALDEALLVGILDLPEKILQPLSLLREQWCAEPTVRGEKGGRRKA